ncbi:hypothetical protein [Sphingomonas bisphenolicum]|uniref:Uncharacterized protein n=1 Tax=Sphingomonas bisphenolicum TaxID=296544 RepID=A0ABM7G4A4_9SPHN|nr:hypothetical protein [Sphingomonas bisphenolicum]BBF70221.1 hypothetical protein SBA_ch1_24210 [Sphingomonas bisphenolicum]
MIEGIAPFSSPVLLTDDGSAWVPDAFAAGHYRLLPICKGIEMGWAPVEQISKAIIVFAGGTPMSPTGEIVATALSRDGLSRLIADLQSIDRQWSAM